jgi:hypothetical protein
MKLHDTGLDDENDNVLPCMKKQMRSIVRGIAAGCIALTSVGCGADMPDTGDGVESETADPSSLKQSQQGLTISAGYCNQAEIDNLNYIISLAIPYQQIGVEYWNSNVSYGGDRPIAPLLMTWFGNNYNTQYYAGDVLGETYDLLHSSTTRLMFNCDSTAPSCGGGTIANYEGGYPWIRICDPYWGYSDEDKTVFLLHELTHWASHKLDYGSVGYVTDWNNATVYGPSACQNLAQTNPNGALHNADNYANFYRSAHSW